MFQSLTGRLKTREFAPHGVYCLSGKLRRERLCSEGRNAEQRCACRMHQLGEQRLHFWVAQPTVERAAPYAELLRRAGDVAARLNQRVHSRCYCLR